MFEHNIGRGRGGFIKVLGLKFKVLQEWSEQGRASEGSSDSKSSVGFRVGRVTFFFLVWLLHNIACRGARTHVSHRGVPVGRLRRCDG